MDKSNHAVPPDSLDSLAEQVLGAVFEVCNWTPLRLSS
jgi:hypothetical protein